MTVLGIDETRRGRPTWEQDRQTGKWRMTERFETNFVDLGQGHGGGRGCLGRPLAVPGAPSWPGWMRAAGVEGRCAEPDQRVVDVALRVAAGAHLRLLKAPL